MDLTRKRRLPAWFIGACVTRRFDSGETATLPGHAGISRYRAGTGASAGVLLRKISQSAVSNNRVYDFGSGAGTGVGAVTPFVITTPQCV
jgi:hypothetical protein